MALFLVTDQLHKHPDWHADGLRDFSQFLSREVPKKQMILYRGQDAGWPLLPYISRTGLGNRFLDAEAQMLRSFKEASRTILETKPRTDWDWLV